MRVFGPPPPGFVSVEPYRREPAYLAKQLRDGLAVSSATVAIIVGVFALLTPAIASVIALVCLATLGFVGLSLSALGNTAWSEARKELATYPTARQVSPRS